MGGHGLPTARELSAAVATLQAGDVSGESSKRQVESLPQPWFLSVGVQVRQLTVDMYDRV